MTNSVGQSAITAQFVSKTTKAYLIVLHINSLKADTTHRRSPIPPNPGLSYAIETKFHLYVKGILQKVKEFKMRLDHFITYQVEAVEALATVKETAERMQALKVGFMPVHLEGGLVGVVTNNDIETRTLAQGLDPAEATVAEIMTAQVLTCSQDDTAETAIDLMNSNNVRRLIVTNAQQHVVGIVSLSDLALPAALNSLNQVSDLPLLSFPVSQMLQKDYAQ